MNEALNKIKRLTMDYSTISKKVDEILAKVSDDKTTGYIELLTLLHEARINQAILVYTANNILNATESFSCNEEEFAKVWYASNPYDYHVPKFFIDNGEAIRIRLSTQLAKLLASKYEKAAQDFTKCITDTQFLSNYGAIKSKIGLCKELIQKRLDEIELKDDDFFDDMFLYNIANKAISRAYGKNNINECSLLPDEIREKVIEIFHHDLNIYDTNDIGRLYYLGLERMTKLNLLGDKLLDKCEETAKKRSK